MHKIKTSGDIVFSKEVTGIIGPIDITIDNGGLLYIVDWKTKKLVRVTQDGSLKDVLVHRRGLNQSYSLQFSRDL